MINKTRNEIFLFFERPTKESDTKINPNELYLVDSGGQYKLEEKKKKEFLFWKWNLYFREGTTDVTRTVHFGQPTDFEKVLKMF